MSLVTGVPMASVLLINRPMHRNLFLACALALLAVGVCASGSAAGIVVDHRSVALFDQIPEPHLTAARHLRMLFSDRSVGQNIHEALDCLAAPSWAQSVAACRRDYYDTNWHWKTFTQADRDAGLVPQRILFDPDPVRYSRSNWTFELRSGTWSELTQDFIQSLAPQYLATKDVLSYQFSYLNVADGDDIASPTTGFFADNANKFDVHDLEAFIAQHTNKVFIFWTTSLARGIGTQVSTDFNEQMRAYCRTHHRILFDVADIESHTDTGCPCYDNRDGVPYVSQTGQTEDHSDDGLDLPAICQDYTTETDGGHLGSVSAGKILTAKAFWVLMARVAGWNPSALPDDWLRQYNLPLDGSADFADTDGDSMDNYGEWVAGTNPTNAASRLVIQSVLRTVPTNALVLSWTSVAGRVYHVEARTNLVVGAWVPVATRLPANPPLNSWIGAVPARGEQYYRVVVMME